MIKKIIVLMFMMLLFAYPVYANGDYTVVVKNCDIPQYVTENLTPCGKSGRTFLTSEETVGKYGEYFESVIKNEQIDVYGIPDSGYEVPVTFSTEYTLPGQYSLINVGFMRDITTFGEGVKVAVIDTGCYNHPDLEDSLKGGYNYVAGSEDFTDGNGHGTHVAGIIAASLDGTTTGIAPEAQIYALKCVDDNKSSTIGMFTCAIYDAVDYYDCDIISMSIGIDDYSDIRKAVNYAYSKGVIFVAAAGNDGNKTNPYKVWYPAGYGGVIGVGSCYNSADGVKRSSFSQKSTAVMVCAPGELVRSTYKDDRYYYMSGTSQATPMVSAIAALAKSINPDVTADVFMEYLKTTSVTANDDYCGYGMIDAKAIFEECIKDRKWYVSPITDSGISIYNNTGDDTNVSAILVGTDGGDFARMAVCPVSIENQQKITFNPVDMTLIKLFLWKSNLKPLIKPIVQ